MMANILLVEDEKNAREILSLGLESHGHQVATASGVEDAEQQLRQARFDLVLTDLRMQGRDAGLDVVKLSVELQPAAKVLLLTAYASTETAVNAMRLGAFDYLTKPVSADELGEAVERSLSSSHAGSSTKKKAGTSEYLLLGESVVMQRVRERLYRASARDFTVLITGESGTGKELAARFLHASSPRKNGPFVPVHCGAIPENLFESELFGYRKGAFTGADADRAGLIEAANHGTLFLDEIGEMPQPVQVKLLRVLQDMRVRRVGSDKETQVNVRVVAATNRDLDEEVRQGNFREDLFYRLNVVPVHMPPLRQRREDIPQLVQALLKHAGCEDIHISPACMQRLSQLPLMGNVRELENLLHRILALSDEDSLDTDILDELYPKPEHEDISLQEIQSQGLDLDQALASVERKLLDEAIQQAEGNATRAAKLLGISFRSIRYRLKKLGMKGEE